MFAIVVKYYPLYCILFTPVKSTQLSKMSCPFMEQDHYATGTSNLQGYTYGLTRYSIFIEGFSTGHLSFLHLCDVLCDQCGHTTHQRFLLAYRPLIWREA